MRDGAVLAASTPAAPGIESLLLRSGRVSEADWSEVFTAAAPYGWLAEELVERGLLGAAAIEVLTQTAVFDAIFAIALGGVTACTARPAAPGDLPPLPPAEPGLDTGRIVRETHRRLEEVPLAELPIGELRDGSSPDALLDPAPSAETAAELPRRRRGTPGTSTGA